MFLMRLTRALKKEKIEYAIVGGFAVALHGAVRGTIDIDIIIKITQKNFISAERALKSIGLVSQLPITAKDIFHFRQEYIKNRNLVAWNFCNPINPTENVDVIITHDLSKMKIKKIKVGDDTIAILAIDDLIRMKKQSGRPQDLEDIKALEELKA